MMNDDDSVDDTMYPFHASLEPPYVTSKAPKFRADDVVTVMTCEELKLSDKLCIGPGIIIQ